MRPSDKLIFSQVARQLGLWILVRRTNPASLKYIGRPGYVPKPIDCKAKTADRDVGRWQLAGLVADPTLCPEAFGPAKLAKATEIWTTFSREQALGWPGARYAVVSDRSSPHYGGLTLHGNYIHGDYDLYDIVDPEQARRNLAAIETSAGQPHMRGPNVYKVMTAINSQIGAPMLQHGGEMQYTDHSQQAIDVFGPAGEECTILNEFSVRGWYHDRFSGRQPIKLPH